MEFNNRPTDQKASNQVPGYNYFAEQARRVGYMGSYGGQFHPGCLQGHTQPQPQPHLHPHLHPHPHPQPQPPHHHPLVQPHDLHEAMNREIEKQRIREEIILSEIARRCVLEAEVRRELMMERELALRRGDDGFPFVPPLGTAFDSTIRPPVLNETQNVEFNTAPFQRCITVPRISEVRPVSQGVKEKEKVVLLAKPQEHKPGDKRKASISSVADDAKLLSAAVASKKAKEEWSCALCQVIATSEQALKDHVKGKKHKSKEAALRARRAGKDYTIGFFPKKSSIPVSTKSLGNSQLGSKGMQSAGNGKKNKFKFWCEICQVGAFCETVMNAHKVGKKHVRRLQYGNGDGKNVTVENVGEVIERVSSNNHGTVKGAKAEAHKAMEATKLEENGAMSATKVDDNNEGNNLAEQEDVGAVNAAKPDDDKVKPEFSKAVEP